MTCSKSAANELGLSKQDNTNGTCAADVEQIIIWLANNTVKKITENMTCSKSIANVCIEWDHANETIPMVHADNTGQIIM